MDKSKYRNIYFKEKLQKARLYKRPIKKISKNKLDFFLNIVGFEKKFNKLIFLCLTCVCIYVFFVPNFLHIKNIEIYGLSKNTTKDLEVGIKKYLTKKTFISQANWIVLSREKLLQFILQNYFDVKRVVEIKKIFPNKIYISAEERYESFLLNNDEKKYLISNDGIITREIPKTEETNFFSQNRDLIEIRSQTPKIFYEKQNVTTDDFFARIERVLDFTKINNLGKIKKIFLQDFDYPYIIIYIDKGFEIKLDISSDLGEVFLQIKHILTDIGNERTSGIKYVDVRIKNKGFVCYKDAECALSLNPDPIQLNTQTELTPN